VGLDIWIADSMQLEMYDEIILLVFVCNRDLDTSLVLNPVIVGIKIPLDTALG